MNKIFYLFRLICATLIFSVFPVLGFSNTVKIVYSDGLAEADGRSAYLEINLNGRQVTGKMVAKGLCDKNIRLPTTNFSFRGNLSGNLWEDVKSEITGSWTGGDYGCDGKLMVGYPTKGLLRIKMLSGNSVDKAGSVYLTRIASSTYGYLFKPRGEKYFPDEQESENIPPWVKNPQSPERAALQLANSSTATYDSVGPPAPSYKMPDFSNSNFKGVVTLSYKETRAFFVNPSEYGVFVDTRNKDKIEQIGTIFSATLERHFTTSNLKIVSASSRSVNVRGEKEGVGQIWLGYDVDFSDVKGVSRKAELTVSWYVLIGKDALAKYQGKKPGKSEKEKPQKTDIPKVVIEGKAIRQGSNEPASGARIYLVPQMTEEVCSGRDDGSFSCTFSKQQSGRYELMIQKPSDRVDLPPIESVELDLWPIKRYMVDLDPEKASAGPINVGTIWMDRIGMLCGNSNACRAQEEMRGTSSVSKSEQESIRHENKGDDLANSGKYQEALEFYDKSFRSTENSERKEKLQAKIASLKKRIDSANKITLSGNWSEGVHGIWTFDPAGKNQYQAHFRGEVNADGPARMQGQNLTIDIQYKETEVHYNLVLSENNQSLVGEWTAKKAGKLRTKSTVLKRDGDTEKGPNFKGTAENLWGVGEDIAQQPDEDGFTKVLDY